MSGWMDGTTSVVTRRGKPACCLLPHAGRISTDLINDKNKPRSVSHYKRKQEKHPVSGCAVSSGLFLALTLLPAPLLNIGES